MVYASDFQQKRNPSNLDSSNLKRMLIFCVIQGSAEVVYMIKSGSTEAAPVAARVNVTGLNGRMKRSVFIGQAVRGGRVGRGTCSGPVGRRLPIRQRQRKDISTRRSRIEEEAKLQARKIDHTVFREMVAKCIIKHDLPFAYVEYERVRSVWKYLNANVNFIIRNTATTDVLKLYENETENLKRELVELPGRISFTSDFWISQEDYMCLTAHYIDNNWKLNNKIIAFFAFKPPHTGMHIAMEILQKWQDWRIEKKCSPSREYFHVRCAAHILNIIVQIGLKDIGPALGKSEAKIKIEDLRTKLTTLFESYENKSIFTSSSKETRETNQQSEKNVGQKRCFGNYEIILDVLTVGGRLMLVDMAGSENIDQAGQTWFEAKMQILF
ncbi:unnamed protein product [Arabidopsis thaliana]|uniref:(thale cress) hypothetical protein n=1 Tax=Arabidopsis thaliana TaxID=3702 RepID=A0A7G2E8I3_ARATH|nr:unnamed protein product [Arabidopsis thaliana]